MRNNSRSFVSAAGTLLLLALALFAFTGVALSGRPAAAGPASQATGEATATVGAGTDTVPAPEGTVPGAQPSVPAPINTGEVPQPVASAPVVTDPNANSDVAPSTNNTGAPENTGNTGTGGTTTTASAQNGSSPWLPLLVGLVVLLLAAIAFTMLRQRRAAPAPAVARSGSTSGSNAPTVAQTGVTSMGFTAPADVAPPATAANAPSGAVSPVEEALVCPNCNTTNDWSENFCHECGEDLRPVRARLIAAAAPPPDVVTDEMPYLETLDRLDEQLEYVLSRPRVVIGSAPGCDIVIDSGFDGAASVSARHAELRREGDGFLIADLNSQSGTYVNDARTGENLLANGDVIRVGNVRFVYRVP